MGLLQNASLLILIFGLFIQFIVLSFKPPKIISNFLNTFADEKDKTANSSFENMFITPITLHLAMAVPVWFFEKQSLASIGVISIGVGDSFAGIFGSRYG